MKLSFIVLTLLVSLFISGVSCKTTNNGKTPGTKQPPKGKKIDCPMKDC